MDHVNHSKSIVYTAFLQPVFSIFSDLAHQRECPAIPDLDWIKCGIFRCLGPANTGRGFLQSLTEHDRVIRPKLSSFFEALKSFRRGLLIIEANLALVDHMKQILPPSSDPLSDFPQLDGYDIFAGDGHYHKASTHDQRKGEANKKYPTGHFYALNLRTRALTHLCVGKSDGKRKLEHDMHALKSLSNEQLRQSARCGQKVIYVWDKAGIDFRQWYRWKQSGAIYFISCEKSNMKLEVLGINPFDRNSPINAGVEKDEAVGSSNGVSLRRVTYRTQKGKGFVFVTSLTNTAIEPGLIARLYEMRWDVEKAFDEVKNKLNEQKAWAKSDASKIAQANFICLAHNLLVCLESKLAVEEKIENVAENRRRKKRLENNPHPMHKLSPGCFDRAKVISVKFIRWLLLYSQQSTSWDHACDDLRRRYKHL